MTKENELLTAKELTLYLKISRVTIYRLISEGKIPCFKIGNTWRFRKAAIDRWLKRQERIG